MQSYLAGGHISSEQPRAGLGRTQLPMTVGIMVWVALHVFWSLRAEINWDEFALLARAADTVREGVLHGGGRPGLATIVLLPLVGECSDAVSAVRLARLWWAPFSVAILVGLWLTLGRLFAGRQHAHVHALVGVLLVALTPNFMRFAIQVRTDQPAIALGLIAGAVLIARSRRLDFAVYAGLLFGAGYLFSQKLIYVGALVSLLALGDLLLRGEFEVRREALRVLAVCLAFFSVLAVFRVTVAAVWEPPPVTDLAGQMNVFQLYREAIGYRYYREMLPGLVGPIILLVVYLSMLGRALSRPGEARGPGLLSVAVLALGVAVGLFHAGAFPYFWMTLGLFPGIALAIGLPLLDPIQGPVRRVLMSTVFVVLSATAVAVGSYQSRDGQAVQRSTMRFVAANIPPELEGFQTTRALFCRDGKDPLPTFFGQNIIAAFQRGNGEEAAANLIAEFRGRPIGYLVHSFRMDEFPASVQEFWAEHYVPYFSAVHLPGFQLTGSQPEVVEFEVLVPGYYTFHAEKPGPGIQVNGEQTGPGDRIWLEAGFQEIRRLGEDARGLFALWVPEAPGSAGETFYSRF